MGEGMAWRSGHWRRMAYGGRRARHPRPPWATAALAERRWSTIVDRVRGGTGRIRYQWLLIVAIAAGLIGMHHLVAGHGGQEGQSAHTPMTIAAGPGLSLMSPTPTEHSHAGLAMNPVLARVAANPVLASHPCCCDPMDLVGHCCLAVLTAMTALAAALVLVTAWRRLWEPGHLLVGVGAVPARAPPTGSVRFIQLGVLRR